MILIKKGKEPWKLKEHREIHRSTYDNLPTETKNKLRETLLAEQGYLCAYCMGGITKEKMKIEHLACQSLHPDKQLDYNNLLACCCGESCGDLHCDTNKRNKEMAISPLRPECIRSLRYKTGTGEIESTDPSWNEEINEVLNLNTHILMSNRLQALRLLKNQLIKKSPSQLLSYWKGLNTEGKRKPFCGIAIYFLQKRLR